jgi:hypothetical protein
LLENIGMMEIFILNVKAFMNANADAEKNQNHLHHMMIITGVQ